MYGPITTLFPPICRARRRHKSAHQPAVKFAASLGATGLRFKDNRDGREASASTGWTAPITAKAG